MEEMNDIRRCMAALVIFLLALLFGASAEAGRRRVEIRVPGIECATSAMRATDAVSSVSGVVEVVDGDQMLRVLFDDEKTGPGPVYDALKKAGFPPEGEPRYVD